MLVEHEHVVEQQLARAAFEHPADDIGSLLAADHRRLQRPLQHRVGVEHVSHQGLILSEYRLAQVRLLCGVVERLSVDPGNLDSSGVEDRTMQLLG